MIQRVSLVDNVVEAVKVIILSGEVRDGASLPSQDDLARRLGVSRSSLREALNRLTQMGVIEARQGKGTFVRSQEDPARAASSSASNAVEEASPGELLDALLRFEPPAAALAAERRTREDLDHLGGVLESLGRKVRDGEGGWLIEEMAFHVRVARCTGNRAVAGTIEAIRKRLAPWLAHALENAPSGPSDVFQAHRDLLKALCLGDGRKAGLQMERTIKVYFQQPKSCEEEGGYEKKRFDALGVPWFDFGADPAPARVGGLQFSPK
jgi:GntR family transcriptional regulator, transcriptional repressor for pyruvate dehydrogenase complex